MYTERPYVLTLAGFDPSSGAGITADIKTFENHRVYGLGVLTANTIQTENTFESITWETPKKIQRQLQLLLEHYPVCAVKIGIIPHIKLLKHILKTIRQTHPNCKVVWDPVLKSSTEFQLTTLSGREDLTECLELLDLVTPNFEEMNQLVIGSHSVEEKAIQLSHYCPVLLKGGHNKEALGTDYLIRKKEILALTPTHLSDFPKHGSGCVLSAVICAQLAHQCTLEEACHRAKTYIENFLNSNPLLLGYHDT